MKAAAENKQREVLLGQGGSMPLDGLQSAMLASERRALLNYRIAYHNHLSSDLLF